MTLCSGGRLVFVRTSTRGLVAMVFTGGGAPDDCAAAAALSEIFARSGPCVYPAPHVTSSRASLSPKIAISVVVSRAQRSAGRRWLSAEDKARGALQTPISGLPEIGTVICASRVNPTCVDRYGLWRSRISGAAQRSQACADCVNLSACAPLRTVCVGSSAALRAAPHPGHGEPSPAHMVGLASQPPSATDPYAAPAMSK